MSNFYSQTNFAFLIDRIVLIFFMLGDNVAKELKLNFNKKNCQIRMHWDYYVFINAGSFDLI